MLLGNKVLNRTAFEDLKNTFRPFNIDETFLKENIQKMLEIKNTKLINECVNLGIPKEFAKGILDETKTVDDGFSKGVVQ